MEKNIKEPLSMETIKKLESQFTYTDDRICCLADFFKILGDPTRLKILSCLLISEMCVNDLAVFLNMTGSAISHQLRVLKQAKLVKSRRDGKLIYYSPNDYHINEILHAGFEHTSE